MNRIDQIRRLLDNQEQSIYRNQELIKNLENIVKNQATIIKEQKEEIARLQLMNDFSD